MRQVGTLTNENDAHRFAAYLVTLGMAAHAEQEGRVWTIWVRDENDTIWAKAAFQQFADDPSDARYQDAEGIADSIRREAAKQRDRAGKNAVETAGKRTRPPAQQRKLLTLALIVISVLVALTSNFGANRTGVVMRTLQFADPIQPRGWDGASLQDRLINIRQGQIWRLATPIFVHLGVVHLVFNMIWLYYLGGQIEDRRGPWRLGAMIMAIALASVAAQSLTPFEWGGSPFGGGMSGVVYGLFGYVWMKMLFDPAAGMHVGRDVVIILMGWLLLGVFGVLDAAFGIRVGNWAHGVGLAAGAAIGCAGQAWKRLR